MQQTTPAYILSHFHSSVHDAIKYKSRQSQATYIALAANIQPASPQFGVCSVVCVGPCCTYRTLADCEGKWLNDEPDKRQTFTHYAEVPDDWRL